MLDKFKIDVSPGKRDIINRFVAANQEAAAYRYKGDVKYVEVLNRLYGEEIKRRALLLEYVQQDRDRIGTVLSYISEREHIVDFCIDWCWTYDPRNAGVGLPTKLPWIPFPRQIELIEWVYNVYFDSAIATDKKGGLVEKSREMGLTWLFCLIFLQEWRWTPGFSAGIGSNKIENVDDRDNPKAIFHKIRYLRDNLPRWWLPKGYTNKRNDKIKKLFNPEYNSSIAGDGGENIGMGNRTSIYLVDEAAALDNPTAADRALSYTTNCQFDVSTPKGLNHFGQKRHSGSVHVFRFFWNEDPRKNGDWFETEKHRWRYAPEIFASEVLVSYKSSVSNLMIDPEWVLSAVDLKIPNPDGTVGIGLDVAAGGANHSAIVVRKGNLVCLVDDFDFINGYDVAARALDEGRQRNAHYLNYDKIGVGHAVHSYVETNREDIAFEVNGVEAGGRASSVFYKEFGRYGNEIFYNARSEWWYIARKKFFNTHEYVNGKHHDPEELISIPNHGELIAQLSAPKKETTDNNKIKVESKKDMLRRGIRSPDIADAFIMAIIPSNAGIVKVIEKNIIRGYKYRMSLSGLSDHSNVVISLWMEPSMKTSITCSTWNSSRKTLYVFAEYEYAYPAVKRILEGIKEKFRVFDGRFDALKSNKVVWLGNNAFFTSDNKTTDLSFKFSENGIYLEDNTEYEEYGAIEKLNDIHNNGRLWVHEDCSLSRAQISAWAIYKDKPDAEFGMARSVANTMSVIIDAKRFGIPQKPEKPYSKKRSSLIEKLHGGAGQGAFGKIDPDEKYDFMTRY